MTETAMAQTAMTQTADSKAKILNAFQQILADRQTIARVATREEEAERAKNQEILETAARYTSDSIVRGLADLQLEFGGVVRELSAKLTTETTKLDELKRAIAVEINNLQTLQKTRVVADALYLLTQDHQENLRVLEQRAANDRESLAKEISEHRKLWQREQAEFEAAQAESIAALMRVRQQQEADYQYEMERSRKIATDEYEETQRQVERELTETTQAKQKDWAERERILAANQTVLAEYQRQIEAFPAQLDDAIKKSREEGIRDANQDAKVKADLIEKEWDATKQSYELQIQALEAKIQKQTEQIAEISAQLQAAMRQAQELAMRAFASSPDRRAA